MTQSRAATGFDPRSGKAGDDHARAMKIRAFQAEQNRLAAAEEERKAAIRKRVMEGPPPNRSFAEQIDALRRLCDRQLALLEGEEQDKGILGHKDFQAIQKLAFVVRSLSQEARANAAGFDAAQASDDELEVLAGNVEGK